MTQPRPRSHLTSVQRSLLACLDGRGAVPTCELRERLGLKRDNLGRVVRSLTALGYVEYSDGAVVQVL